MGKEPMPVFVFGCMSCGKTVDGHEETCPRCGASFEGVRFECPFCGGGLEDGSRRIGWIGTRHGSRNRGLDRLRNEGVRRDA
jgi:predicted amidophosphoribosyltransferase